MHGKKEPIVIRQYLDKVQELNDSQKVPESIIIFDFSNSFSFISSFVSFNYNIWIHALYSYIHGGNTSRVVIADVSPICIDWIVKNVCIMLLYYNDYNIYTYVCVCIHIHTYIYIYICVHMCVCVCINHGFKWNQTEKCSLYWFYLKIEVIWFDLKICPKLLKSNFVHL